MKFSITKLLFYITNLINKIIFYNNEYIYFFKKKEIKCYNVTIKNNDLVKKYDTFFLYENEIIEILIINECTIKKNKEKTNKIITIELDWIINQLNLKNNKIKKSIKDENFELANDLLTTYPNIFKYVMYKHIGKILVCLSIIKRNAIKVRFLKLYLKKFVNLYSIIIEKSKKPEALLENFVGISLLN